MRRPAPLPPRQRLATRAGTLEFAVAGEGAPVLVLANGAGVTLQGWGMVWPQLAQLGTVFAWNRFGVGASDPPRLPQRGSVVIASWRELLAYAGLAPPYVLVGHSLGGLYVNLFARLYPDEVAGVVLLEATHPRDRASLKGHETRLAGVLGKLFAMPQQLFRRNLHAEIEWVDATAQEIASAGPFPPVPLTVVTGGNDPPKWMVSPEALRIRRAHQRELAQLSPLGEQVIATTSGHFPQITQPALVVDVLRRMAQRAAGPPVPAA